MSLFERITEKNINLTEQPFSDKQKSDMKDLLNKNFGSKKKAKITAGKVIKDTAKKDVERFFAKAKNIDKGSGAISKNPDYSNASSRTGSMKSKMRSIEGDKQSNKIRAEIERQTGTKTREFTQRSGVTQGNEKPRTVKQSEVSKKAKEFTSKINKRRANRIKDATGGKKTGSLRKGNLSFPGDRSGATQQVKADITARQGLRNAGASGDVRPTAPKNVRDFVTKTRETRASKLKTPDPFKIDTSKAAKETAKTFGTKPVKGGLDFGKPRTGSIVKYFRFSPRDLSTQRAAAKTQKSFSDFSKKLAKAGANIEIEKKVNKPSYKIKSKGSGASTGGSTNYSNTSSRTGNMKGGSKPKSGSSSTGGGGYKPPKTPKGGTLGFPEPPKGDGINAEPVNNIPKGKPKITGDTYDNLSKGSKYKTFKQFGKEVDTLPGRKAFDARKVKRMSKLRYKGLGGKPSVQPVRRVLKPAAKALVGAAKKNPKTALIGGALALAYGGYKAFGPKPDVKDTLSNKDFTKATKTGIVRKDGSQVRRKLNFGNKVKNQKPQETVSSISKKVKSDNTGEYRVK